MERKRDWETAFATDSPKELTAREKKTQLALRKVARIKEALALRKKQREEEEERQRQQEHEQLLRTTSVREYPFLFLPDEIVLRIFSYLREPLDLVSASAVSKRFHAISDDEELWKSLCTVLWEKLPESKLFYRNGGVSWKVTLKNNYFNEMREKKALAQIVNPTTCIFCGQKAATRESVYRNCMYYISWTKCYSCGKLWNWSYGMTY